MQFIWHNPPYWANAKTNIGKILFKLLDEHFPREHKFYKLSNINTVKSSCSSIKNRVSLTAPYIGSIIKSNNQVYWCICRQDHDCPLRRVCLTPAIVYQSIIIKNKDDANEIYYGLCENAFKDRYRNPTFFYTLESF